MTQINHKCRHETVPRAPNPMPISRTATVYGMRVFCKTCRHNAPSPRETPMKISAISGEYPSACPEGGGAVNVLVELDISGDSRKCRCPYQARVNAGRLSGRKSMLSLWMKCTSFPPGKKILTLRRARPCRELLLWCKCHYRLLVTLSAFSNCQGQRK